jgi:CAAX protease family protein
VRALTSCLLHPEREASGNCEFCTQPHCAQCLQPLLGRVYCPSCYERVQAVATGRPAGRGGPSGVSASGVSGGGAHSGGAGPLPDEIQPQPRLPGWLSALLYLAGFFLFVKVAAESTLVLPLLFAKFAAGRLSLEGGLDARTLLDPSGLGLGRWSLLLSILTWGSLLTTLAYTAFVSRWLERRRLLDLGLRLTRSFPRDLILGLGLAAVLFISVAGVGAGRDWYVIHPAASGAGAAAVAVVGLLLLLPYAAVEEICFRGYVLPAVARSWGKAGGVLVSSLAFALIHSFQGEFWRHPLALPGIFLAGVYLASAYLITGNLWLAIFLHAGWNLMEGPIFGLPVSGLEPPASVLRTEPVGPEIWTGGTFGPEASLLLCLVTLIHIAALWALRPFLQPHHPTKGDPLTPDEPEQQVYRAIPLGGVER